MTVRQKVPKLYVLSKLLFDVKNQRNLKKKKEIKNINFQRTGAHRWIFLDLFPFSMLILGQKSCFLGPTIFKIPQPN